MYSMFTCSWSNVYFYAGHLPKRRGVVLTPFKYVC